MNEKEWERKQKLSARRRKELLKTLKARFEKNISRHKGLAWEKVKTRLESQPAKLWSLHEMERTGGEPDVVSQASQWLHENLNRSSVGDREDS